MNAQLIWNSRGSLTVVTSFAARRVLPSFLPEPIETPVLRSKTSAVRSDSLVGMYEDRASTDRSGKGQQRSQGRRGR